ncbi:MAG: DUF3592 domain-containing protein [Planctomycetota bacterium]
MPRPQPDVACHRRTATDDPYNASISNRIRVSGSDMKKPPFPCQLSVFLFLGSIAAIVVTCIDISAKRRLVLTSAVVTAIDVKSVYHNNRAKGSGRRSNVVAMNVTYQERKTHDDIIARLELDESEFPDGAASYVKNTPAGSRIDLYYDPTDHNKVALTNKESDSTTTTIVGFACLGVLGLAGALYFRRE